MQRIFEAHEPTEAHLVKGLLEARGIECKVQGERLYDMWSGMGHTVPDTLPSVWIYDDTRLAEALQIVKEYSERQQRPGPKNGT